MTGHYPYFLAFVTVGALLTARWRVAKKRRERLSCFSCRRLRRAVLATHIIPHLTPSLASLLSVVAADALRMPRNLESEQDYGHART